MLSMGTGYAMARLQLFVVLCEVHFLPQICTRSSFLAMTTLVCRNNTGFDGESRSIAASIRAMAPYNFSWAVYVPELRTGTVVSQH